jgi:hypothetical protein
MSLLRLKFLKLPFCERSAVEKTVSVLIGYLLPLILMSAFLYLMYRGPDAELPCYDFLIK